MYRMDVRDFQCGGVQNSFCDTGKEGSDPQFSGEIKNMEAFREIAKRDFQEAYRLFTDKSFPVVMAQAENRDKALYAGLSRQPVTYQHLEEFFVGLKQKDPVEISLKTAEAEYYELDESVQEEFEIRRSGWGHLRLDVETRGGFLETERHMLTEDEFIGSTSRIEYVIHADRLKDGIQRGKIIVRSPYQELVFPVTASRGANVRADLRAAEKKARLSLIKDYIDYKEGRLDFQDYAGSAHFILNQLRESGSLYPEYQMYEAYVEHLEGRDEEALEILKSYQDKEFTRDEMELAGIYLYLCTLTGLYEDCPRRCGKSRIFICRRRTACSFCGYSFIWTPTTKIRLPWGSS